MTIPYQGYNNDQCTNFDDVLTELNSKIPTPGNGTSATSPQKYLFFVSDGVNDANNPTSCSKPLHGGTRCQEPIDTSVCTTIKNRDIKIAVLYTTYLPLPTNAWYNTWIAPLANPNRHQHAELRLARSLFRGRPEPGHLGGHERAVQEGAGRGALHPVNRHSAGSCGGPSRCMESIHIHQRHREVFLVNSRLSYSVQISFILHELPTP